MDLKDAFFYIQIHDDSQYLTTFHFDGQYYKYNCLPFGLSVSPFQMQMFSNAIAQRFRALGAMAWGHIDDFVIAHLSESDLKQIMRQVLQDFIHCGVLIIHINYPLIFFVLKGDDSDYEYEDVYGKYI